VPTIGAATKLENKIRKKLKNSSKKIQKNSTKKVEFLACANLRPACFFWAYFFVLKKVLPFVLKKI
jgi:hypothetical protein